MNASTARPPELALPVASLAALRRALTAAVGPDAAAHALREAGNAAGHALFRSLLQVRGATTSPPDPADPAIRQQLLHLPEQSFWKRFAETLSSRGWGHLSHEPVHPGVGALHAADWVEADPDSHAARPGCFFTTGLLANLLGRITDSDIAVLEVTCRSRGDEQCRFLFGHPETMAAFFDQVAAGQDETTSLAALAG